MSRTGGATNSGRLSPTTFVPRKSSVPEGSLVVATMTGHGLKDPDIAITTAGFEPTVVEPTADAVKQAIGL